MLKVAGLYIEGVTLVYFQGGVCCFFKEAFGSCTCSACRVAESYSVEKACLNVLIDSMPAQVKSWDPPFIQTDEYRAAA